MSRLRIPLGLRAFAVAGLLGALTLPGAWPALADGWSPGLMVGSRFDRPVPGVPGDGGEWVGSLTPLLLSERLGPYTSWDLRAHRRYDASDRLSGLRASHDVALATLTSRPGESTRLALDGEYFRSRDLFNPDPQASLAGSDQRRAAGAATIETSRAEAGYRVETTRYGSPGLADGRGEGWNAALYARRSEHTRWLLGWRREEWTVDRRTELATSSATVGVRRRHTPTLASELELGLARVADDREGPLRDELAVVAGLSGFGGLLRLPFDARFLVRRDVVTSSTAEIWRPMAGARVGLRWERTLHAGGGVFSEPTHRDLVAFDAQDTLGGRSILSLEGSYRRARPRAGGAERLETYRAAAAVSRDLRPWLRGRLRYSTARQEATAGIAAADFDRNRVEFTLTAVYQ